MILESFKPNSMMLNMKQSQKIVETVYGKTEKQLINKIIKSVKQIIEVRQLEVKILMHSH